MKWDKFFKFKKKKQKDAEIPLWWNEKSWLAYVVNMAISLTGATSTLQAKCDYRTTAPNKDDIKYARFKSRQEVLVIVRNNMLAAMSEELKQEYERRLKKEKKTWRLPKYMPL